MLTTPSAATVVTIVSTITIQSSTRCALRSPGERHVIGDRIVGRREISPRQRAFLPVGLAERHGEAGARELAAQIKRVPRFRDVELGEELGDARGIGGAPRRIARATP